MGELSELGIQLGLPTNQISSEIIQNILIQARKQSRTQRQDVLWGEIIEKLWGHLQAGLTKFDEQLLCAICFYAALPLTDATDSYLNQILHLINKELELRRQSVKSDITLTTVSLIYGMFQSTFLTLEFKNDLVITSVLSCTFDLLLSMAYEYSKYTYIVFKTISSFKKVCGTNLKHILFNRNCEIRLLNLVNHNWENPITGIRDLNRGVFQMLISIIDEEMSEVIIKEVNAFYWNKAKYLMLTEIIEQYRHEIKNLVQQYDWVDGLLYSLHKPGLVSAGADMYFALLKKLNYQNEWCELYLKGILKISVLSSSKATENFGNYWCLTTFKKFPSIVKILINELESLPNSEQKLYSCLYILKQANRLGLVKKEWGSEDFRLQESLVLCGVEHCNPHIRMLSFDLICVSNSKLVPSDDEYQLVLDYLHYNVNSDCTVLRLNMLNSLNSYLKQLQALFLNDSKSQNHNTEQLLHFCKMLQEFIVKTLNICGNYQRKITGIKICKVVLDCFSNLPKKRQKQGHSYGTMIMQMLKDEECWMLCEDNFILKLLSLLKDPSDDVRDNVVQLLLSHYSTELKSKRLMNQLIEDALISAGSKFFYQTNCTCDMFKLITSILLKETCTDTSFSSAEDIFIFAYKELVNEIERKTDVVTSIETGKQLHSLISILQVVLEVCNENSHKIRFIDVEKNMLELLALLEVVSNQFAWEQVSSTSSDFSKMSDMVQGMIELSGCDHHDDKDQAKISGLHQIILNCLWLNVKASCELAALLIQFTQEEALVDKCLRIITRVLETCRHKGAIEAAGAALGRGIQYLTRLPYERATAAALPRALLERKLRDLVGESAMASVTRRGAGLSIMVHRIVASDANKEKPLFHYFMETLLEICNSIDDTSTAEDAIDADSQKDLPKAIYIHFLTRIVTDSSLASDLMFYSAKLAELAFGNLTSPHWQIRNAALQLYGALIPKLIGQKKASGADDETVATVACDEFRTHSPKLWLHITTSLETSDNIDVVQAHSDLVPILNILANCARRYNFSCDTLEQTHDHRLLQSLLSLLQSPLYTVRRLTAKCIFNIYSFEIIYESIVNQEIKSENLLHGFLTLLTHYHNNNSSNKLYEKHFNILKAKFDGIINNGKHSYLCRQLVESLYPNDDSLDLKEVEDNLHEPGVHLWANKRIEKRMKCATWETVPDILKNLLECYDYEQYCIFILSKIKSSKGIPRLALTQIADQLISFRKKFNSSVIWEILYEISIELDLNFDITDVLKHLQVNDLQYKLRFAIPFAARVATKTEDLLELSKIIYSFSDTETTDVDMRYIAALANNQLALSFKELADDVKINAIQSAVILLQDEDEDIRSLSTHFYKNINNDTVMLNPYVCLCKLLNYEYLHEMFLQPKEKIQILYQGLYRMLDGAKCGDVDEYNPFTNDSKNIYMEVNVMRQLIERIKMFL